MTSARNLEATELDRGIGAEHSGASRLTSFSDSIIAIVLTIMIFDLKPQRVEGWVALIQMWPTILAYALSYLFVAVCWVNHHQLLKRPLHVTPGLMWSNFLFLFTMSFLPASTSYLSLGQFSSFSMQLYALSFLPIPSSYMLLETVVARGVAKRRQFAGWYRRAMVRGCVALAIYGTAALVAARWPKVAFAIILANAVLYLLPERFNYE
jgi:uncharacterized membrane protein